MNLYSFYPKFKTQKLTKSFSMLDTNSGSRTDLKLFIVIHLITVTANIFQQRNVNVVGYKMPPQTLLRVVLIT